MILTNYLKSAVRNFTRRKLYTFINTIGLSVAIAFCLHVYLFVNDELSFDQFHVNKDRIYRLNLKTLDKGKWDRGEDDPFYYSAYLPNALSEALVKEVPEVEAVSLLKEGGERIIRYNDNILMQDIVFTDSSFFDMFSFEVISGSDYRLFQQPSDAAITEATAKKFFGNENPIGKEIYLDFEYATTSAFTIKAVVSAPSNSSIQFELLLPIQSYQPFIRKSWNSNSYPTFVQLREGADPEIFTAKANSILKHNRRKWIERVEADNNLPENISAVSFTLTQLPAIHFDKKVSWSNVSDLQYSWILASIALLIIVIASINYISFALTLSTSRRKEVGIRKTIGATQKQIFIQFTIESLSMTFFAGIIGMGLASSFLPLFNEITQKDIAIPNESYPYIALFLISLILITGLLSGSYPASFLSRIQPALALKSSHSKLKLNFVKPLVVLQFILSAFLMISAVIMYRQMNFITTKDLGYKNENIIALPTHIGWSEESDKVVEQFRNKLKGIPSVLDVSGVDASFNQGYASMSFQNDDHQNQVYIYRVDTNYLSLFDIQLIQGRGFRQDFASDSNAIIVNEAMVKAYGWTDPLNETLSGSNNPKDDLKVIGVVKDYHFLSLEEEIKPLFLIASPTSGRYLTTLLIKLDGNDIPMSLASVEREWKSQYPEKPFNYSFVDVDVARQYEAYNRWMRIMGIATVFAILIACLGLLGLAGINALSRTKEIGIRKVLGADLMSIFILLNKPFVFLALIAFLIATPISIYIMEKWMSNFKYHISLSWEIFVFSIVSGLLIVIAAVSYHGIKAANSNPVDSLRNE